MKERKRTSVLQSARADGDEVRRPPGHLITRAGREEVMRKGGGEEVRSVRCMCDVCAHGDPPFFIKIDSHNCFKLLPFRSGVAYGDERVCFPCSICQDGEYIASPCDAGMDTVRTRLLICIYLTDP